MHYGWLRMLREAFWSHLSCSESCGKRLCLWEVIFILCSAVMISDVFVCLWVCVSTHSSALMCVVVVYEWTRMSSIPLCFAWLLLWLMYCAPWGHCSKLQRIMSWTDCTATDRWHHHCQRHTPHTLWPQETTCGTSSYKALRFFLLFFSILYRF